MKHAKALFLSLTFLLTGAVVTANSEVKTIQMKIAGYLCGN